MNILTKVFINIFLISSISMIFLSLCGCSGLEQSEQEKIRRQNAKGEFVYRRHNEYLFSIEPPKVRAREKYPWELSFVGNFAKITKEHFRCKGSSLNPARPNSADPDQAELLYDCGGIERHSLPVINGKEFIFPILIELLNYVQEKTGKKIVITCGHRCPTHNKYADPSKFNQSSKHMLGAEVDFYIQEMEQKPEKVIELLMNFYKELPRYKGKKDFESFLRYEKLDTNVSTPPWYNKEILIKLFKKNEGRDLDNRHPYPYICIQVRHDTQRDEKIVYGWQKAFYGYKRM
jgi:hypothetical protein